MSLNIEESPELTHTRPYGRCVCVCVCGYNLGIEQGSREAILGWLPVNMVVLYFFKRKKKEKPVGILHQMWWWRWPMRAHLLFQR